MSGSRLPTGRWVLHAAPAVGGITDRWIDTQARMTGEFDSRLLGGRLAPDAARQPYWLVASDSVMGRLAYRWIDASRGWSIVPIARMLRRRPPTVLHAHYGPNGAYHRHLARLLGCPLVTSFYGYDATKQVFFTERRWRRLYEKLFDEARAIVVEGPAMAERVRSLGCPPEKIEIIRLPADQELLTRSERRKADHFLAVAAGRFIEKKGFDTAIRAFARALRGRDDARLLLIGAGELEASLRSIAEAEGVRDQMSWTPILPFTEFMAAIARAHVGLYPSRTASDGDSEGGAPVTLIEAQWLGVPSIVSDHDDLPFVAAPDGSIVLPALAIDRWAEALRDLYENQPKLDAMATRAMTFAKRHHAPATNLAERERVYEG
jgi:colanic acid/amylovoran biosynthesis glycosyltransferase